jgi:acetolactate synthase I/II/III large subunit
MNVAEWITQELINRGVTHVFTLQGGYSMYLNDAIGHSALKPVYMLTESGAAFAAAGYAQYSGKMGVCVVTSGLAQTNALSGVASAYSDYFPMMVISGDVRTEFIHRREAEGLRQGGQQDVPIKEIARKATKLVRNVYYSQHMRGIFDDLWERAMTEPRGPVWLDIPIDVQQEEMPE